MGVPTNYTELKLEIEDWVKRDDLTNHVPMFIDMGENRINRISRLLQQETTASVTLTVGQDNTDLPTDFLDHITLTYDVDDFYEPSQVSITELELKKTVTSGRPNHYAIAEKIYFSQKPDQAYAMTHRYFKRWDIATDSTNWLLTNHPGAYVLTALHAAGIFLKHPMVNQWAEEAGNVLSEIQYESGKVRGRAPLRVDDAIIVPARYNIHTDYR